MWAPNSLPSHEILRGRRMIASPAYNVEHASWLRNPILQSRPDGMNRKFVVVTHHAPTSKGSSSRKNDVGWQVLEWWVLGLWMV
jgi:hypothetical protein